MVRLAGFKYREAVRRLRAFSFVFDRHGPGSHEVWWHTVKGRKVTIPHHARKMAEGILRTILREAGIGVKAFLKSQTLQYFCRPDPPRGCKSKVDRSIRSRPIQRFSKLQ